MGRGAPSSDNPTYDELLARVNDLETRIDQLMANINPANLDARLRFLSDRVDGIETDEDPLPPVLMEEGGGETRVFVDGVEIFEDAWNADPTKPYLRCDFSTTPPTLTEQTGPVPSTWGSTVKWLPKPLGGGWCVFDRIG